jgi:hypothetical protein
VIRDIWQYRYPDGVPIEEGEKWYLGKIPDSRPKIGNVFIFP